ncbi:MAG: hypothetical protein DHS20C11_03170 [Lysobacteraceae bacterium]|nr:MAG: hypothetical protein DHS20C11_03170 [Xanthomonadaceae bacterium]
MIEPVIDHPPRPLAQRLGAIIWPSFFSACVGTMVLFALVDPVELAQISWPQMDISPVMGYSIGFFGLWAMSASACTFCWLLLRPPSRFNSS